MADRDPAPASKTIDLIYFNAGGGHRAAAMALEAVMREQGRPWRVRCVNLFEMLDPAERFRRITGVAPEDLYNLRLATGWTVGLAQELKLLQGLIRIGHGAIVRRVSEVIGPLPQIAPKKLWCTALWQGGMRCRGRPMWQWCELPEGLDGTACFHARRNSL